MKKPITVTIVFVVLVVLFFGFLHILARGSHRARFIIAMNELKDANAELQKHGAVTNRFDDRVYSYTNRFNIDGTIYQCELAVESVDLYLRNRGVLTITTNGILVWVDRERGVMPLGTDQASTFPPGF